MVVAGRRGLVCPAVHSHALAGCGVRGLPRTVSETAAAGARQRCPVMVVIGHDVSER